MRTFPLFVMAVFVLALTARAAESPALSNGIALVGAGDYAAAARVFGPLALENPDDSVVHYWLGRAYYGQQRFPLAVESLGKAVERDGANRDCHLWYARALRAAGRLPDAQQVYAEAHGCFPQDTTILGEYAAVRAQAGDFTGALVSFNLLAKHDPSSETQALVAEWRHLLAGLSSRSQVEPKQKLKSPTFDLQYDAGETSLSSTYIEIERARARVSQELDTPVSGFRVLLFSTWTGYARYARLLLPMNFRLRAAAFTQPGLLVLWSPDGWPPEKRTPEEISRILRHEMAHLAIAQRTGGQGVPRWLNEGLACYYGGGWIGDQSGYIPEEPLGVTALDDALMAGDLEHQQQAYAQAYAMATILVRQLETAGIARLLDRLGEGSSLANAYRQVSGQDYDRFLATWQAQNAELGKR